MKKTLALLMSMALILSLVSGFMVSSNAAVAYVDETYVYQEAMSDYFGNVDGLTATGEYGSYESAEGFFFGEDKVWTLEYLDQTADSDTPVFKPMTAYFSSAPENPIQSWTNHYTPNDAAPCEESGLTYCSVASNGKRLHPGTASGPVITFIVPAGGTISYDLTIGAYGEGNLSTGSAGGDKLELYVNETKVWPTGDDVVIHYDTYSDSAPYEVSFPSFKVNAGDKVRFAVTTSTGNRGSKGVNLVSLPVVTYHEAEVSIGDPNGTPPANVVAERVSKDSTDMKVTWDAAKNAAGYNVYIKGENDAEFKKVNAEPIKECEYVVTGLNGKALYELQVTTIPEANPQNESSPSETQTFLTPKGNDDPITEGGVVDSVTSDNTGNNSSDGKPANSGNNNKPATNKPAEKEGFPLWLIFVIAGGVVAVAAVVVVVLLVVKKKPAAPAEAAEAPEEPKE